MQCWYAPCLCRQVWWHAVNLPPVAALCCVQAVRLMSLTPHLRQLQALVAAQRLPPLLLAELLSPGTTRTAVQRQPKHLATVQPALPPALLHELVGQFNSSQQKAIAAAAAGYLPTAAAAASAGAAAAAAYDGPGSSAARPQAVQQAAREQLVLVQGPPGTVSGHSSLPCTSLPCSPPAPNSPGPYLCLPLALQGKSAAILGMCSALLAANTPRSTIINGSSKGGDGGSKAAAAAALKLQRAVFVNPAVRVLLCAQSNAAVDELCTRLANRGVVGRLAWWGWGGVGGAEGMLGDTFWDASGNCMHRDCMQASTRL